MKPYNITILSLVLSLFVLMACDKKEQANLDDNSSRKAPTNSFLSTINVENGMLIFEDRDMFFKATRSIFDMDEQKRAQWEKSIGFSSFGKEADDFYENIDFDMYSSYDNMIESLVKNDLIDVYITVDKDTSYLQKDYDMPERYLMNTNRMYVIGDMAYKHFSNDTLVTTKYDNNNMSNIVLLENVKDFTQFIGNSAFQVSSAVVPMYEPPSSNNNIICQSREISAYYNAGNNWNQKYRSRVIISEKLIKEHQADYGNVYRSRVTYTLINEKYDRWWLIWYHYWWNNTAYKTNGNIQLYAAAKYKDPDLIDKVWAERFDFPSFNNESIKKKTDYMDARRDFLCIPSSVSHGLTGWDIDLTISSGVYMSVH